MKSPETLIDDIYGQLGDVSLGKSLTIEDDILDTVSEDVYVSVEKLFTARNKPRKEKSLYFSEVGRACHRALWYAQRETEKEVLLPHNLIKFSYGDILEAFVLALCEIAGHEVICKQRKCSISLRNGWEIRGRMDAKIDGHVVDVKSASPYAFKKFDNNTVHMDDPFGYIGQLRGYTHAQHAEGEEYSDTAYFLAIEKSLGKLALASYDFDHHDRALFINEMNLLTEKLEGSEPPELRMDTKPIGKSGNEGLCTTCSYCSYKQECWKDANDGKGLRTFIYSTGPVSLVKVAKVPAVPEV